MIYEIRCNSLTGCLEPVALAGTEKATIGCIWNSTDEYTSIKDCNGCYLANIDAQTVAIGKDTTALNNSIAIGCGNTTTCDGIAIGNQLAACAGEVLISDVLCTTCASVALGKGACVTGDNEIHIKGGCAEITNKCNCINISNEGSTVIDVSDTALNVNSEANIYLNVSCTCIDIKGCSAVAVIDASAVIVGNSATGLSCSVAIGANATTAAACSTAIGYCASANCCCGTAIGASASTDSGVSIGRNAHSDASGTAIGRNSYACSMGVSVGCYAGTYKCGEGATIIGDNAGGTCYGIAVGNLSRSCDYGVAIGYSTYAYGACKSIVIGYGSATLSSNTIVIGNDITADNTCCEGDTLIGSCSNVFKFCGATGYTYGNGCLMTGRIIDCADLPATCCENILFVVP